MTDTSSPEVTRKDEDSDWDRCVDGAKLGAVAGAIVGARYGFRTGMVGAFGTGAITAVVSVPVATVIGTAGGAAIGGVVGCAGNVMVQDYADENAPFAPQADLPKLKPLKTDPHTER